MYEASITLRQGEIRPVYGQAVAAPNDTVTILSVPGSPYQRPDVYAAGWFGNGGGGVQQCYDYHRELSGYGAGRAADLVCAEYEWV